MSTTSPTNFMRILSLDGGGIKGYTSLLILKRIFRTLKDEGNLAEEPRPCDIFDLIVGTSTGGLIAVMLGRLHMTIDQCIKEYGTVARRIFGKKPTGGSAGKLLKGMLSSPFYDIGTLQAVVQDILEKRGISTDEALREATGPICKVMLCVTRKATGKGDVLRNYESRHPTQENYDCSIWEAASATAAAPMYFKSVKFKKQGENWCDGGLRRNNPVREAVAEFYRERSFSGRAISCLISIGTGVPQMTNISASLPGFLKGCVDMLTDSEIIADDFAKEELAKLLTSQGRYYRFSVPQGMQDLEMDEVKEANIENLRGLTTDYLNKIGSGNEVQKCAIALLRPDQSAAAEIAKRLSILPYQRCLHHISREYYVQRLQSFFQLSTIERQSFVLYGMGGVGKTQIALEFAHGHEDRFGIFWVRAESFPSFAYDFGRILQILDPSGEAEANMFGPNQVELLIKTRGLLQNCFSDWIMVLDNADDFDEFAVGSGGGLSINRFLPQSGRFLITTRDPRFLGGFVPAENGIRVNPMRIEDALELMKKSVPKHLRKHFSEDVAMELLEELGNLPLGIAQAAANIGELQLSMDEYVDAYKDRRDRMQLLERPVETYQGIDEPHRPQSVLVTWELAFNNLEQKYPSSAACLRYMGLLHYRNIPQALLQALSEFQTLRKLEFKVILKRLHQASLIETVSNDDAEDDEYNIHPLLHERIFERMSNSDVLKCFEEVVGVMASVFPIISFNENDASRHKGKALAAYLLPHALRVLSLVSELRVASKPCARLLQIVGLFLSTARMTSLAVTLADGALDMAPRVFGVDDPSVHYIRVFRIKCLIADQQLEEAESEIRIALRTLSTEKFRIDHVGEDYKSQLHLVLNLISEMLVTSGKQTQFENIVFGEVDSQFDVPTIYLILSASFLSRDFQRRGELDDASLFLDRRLLQIQQQSPLTVLEEEAYLNLMLLKVQVMASKFNQAEDQEPDRNKKLHRLTRLAEEVFTRKLAISGPTDRHTWVIIQTLLQSQIEMRLYEQAVLSVTELLGRAAGIRIDFETDILESAGIVLDRVQTLIDILYTSHLPQHEHWIARLETACSEMIQYQGLKREDFLVTYLLSNAHGVHHQSRGRFAAAYSCHIRALELEREVNEPKKAKPAGILLYNIMLAVARQPGREKEAMEFRKEYLEELQGVERIYGDLPSRSKRDASDKALYNEAKEKIQRGELKFNDEWWLENKDALKRTELRYGLLDIKAI